MKKVLIGISIAAILALMGFFFWGEIRSWFVHAQTSAPQVRLNEPSLQAMQKAFQTYEEIRVLLAKDSMDGIVTHSQAIVEHLQKAHQISEDMQILHAAISNAVQAAEQLGKSQNLEMTREHFGKLSQYLMELENYDSRLAKDWNVFYCPMAKEKWFQRSREIANPYMGQQMLSCGSAATWETQKSKQTGTITQNNDDIAYYTCSMHPSVRSKTPGKCPICSMDLLPVTHKELETGMIFVDAQRRQLIGVKTGIVQKEELVQEIRTVARVQYDETRLFDVNLKFQGWIGEIFADYTGKFVEKGSPLFTVYSPEVFASQEEYLEAASEAKANPARGTTLLGAAKKRLLLWDFSEYQLVELLEKGTASPYLPFLAPAGGTIIQKNVVQGSSIMPGKLLYRIADLSNVWLEADIYEYEVPLIQLGQTAKITLSYFPQMQIAGKVAYIYPYLNPQTRTAKIRVEVPNPNGELKPEMFANITLQIERGQKLVVPEEAVIFAGEKRIVFVDHGEGRLEPRKIKTGIQTQNWIEVLSGLDEGESIVTSGNFLIASESKLKSAVAQW